MRFDENHMKYWMTVTLHNVPKSLIRPENRERNLIKQPNRYMDEAEEALRRLPFCITKKLPDSPGVP